MSLDADSIVDRRRLRRKLTVWRVLAVLLAISAVLAVAARLSKPDLVWSEATGSYMARVAIRGLIRNDQERTEALERLAKSQARAVIVHIDSPGGTAAGAEQLYDSLRAVAAKKPMVIVVDGLAASGGYIAALAGDHIVTRSAGLLGSIGVLFQYPNVSDLLKTIGVKVEEVKSSPLKAAPNGFEPTSPEARAAIEAIVKDSYAWFRGLVKDRRQLDDALLERVADGKAQREEEMRRDGYPAYSTSVGWLGFSDDEVRHRCRAAVAEGWSHVKMKVGGSLDDDLRRAALIREEIGSERFLMMDANQVWEVDEAIAATRRLAEFDPWWMEEPTSPDDVLGHARIAREVAPIRIATGEHAHNRTMFKQLMQADAIGVCQIDSCRLGGVNEVLAVLLLAARFGVPVCPHAGGVGLCEYVQHLALVDYVAISADLTDRVLEYVDELHEHFVEPVRMRGGRYVVPEAPGYSIEMRPESLEEFAFPGGEAWR
jgi:signal peptide peptidase SppA